MRGRHSPRLALILSALFLLVPLFSTIGIPLDTEPNDRTMEGAGIDDGGVEHQATEVLENGLRKIYYSAKDVTIVRQRDPLTHFAWQPLAAEAQPANVSLIGEWNWSTQTDLALNSSTGEWSASVNLSEGLYCYKFVIGEADYRFDPSNDYRGYCGDYENSVVRVDNKSRPMHSIEMNATTGLPERYLTHAGSGGSMMVNYLHSYRASSLDILNVEDDSSEVWNVSDWSMSLNTTKLANGKHTLIIDGQDDEGNHLEPLIVPFWKGPQQDFIWQDALIYMVMTDRFVNGDLSNDMTNGSAAAGADWRGGDFAGVTQMINNGYFTNLGVNALWLTPFNTAANTTGTAGDGNHEVSGYHGYWPSQPREVEPRLGTEQELYELVNAAHAAGIRVIGDFVVNHVYQDHPYFSDQPDWFNEGCLCGSQDCDWTEHRLDCLFRDYMPDINWKNRNASEAMIADALWWLERFDLDGARIDAVKHVDDLAVTNLAMRVNERFEIGGVDYYLKGETAMGWVGDDLAANAAEYEMINRYIGPNKLDGQADFVLYHAVVDNVFTKFATGDATARDYQHLDYWTVRSQDQYVLGATMVPFVGSHDVPRFASRADSGTADEWNQWVEQGLPGQPSNSGPYEAALQAYTWLLTTPGAPLIYAGDEYGEYGGADPDNRHMWRDGAARSGLEAGLAENISTIAALRSELEPLRRGNYASLHNSSDAIAWSMATENDSTIIVMNRAATSYSFSLDPAALSALPTEALDSDSGEAIGWQGSITSRFGNITILDGALTLPPSSVAIFQPPSSNNAGSGSGNLPLPPTDCAPLNLSIIQTPLIYDPLSIHLPKSISVFGIYLMAAPNVPNATLEHAAAVMAGYLDNDADGVADDLAVVQEMVNANAAMVMPKNEDDMETIFEALPESFHQKVESGEIALQDLYASEVHPGGRGGSDFDATLEEVLHLVTHIGYANAYPDKFAETSGSNLTALMDLARGGHYEESNPDECEDEQGPCALPASGYPASSWYHYEDGTCDYSCMATEYIYWSLTTYMGVQNDSARCVAIDSEWEPCSVEELAATDPGIYSLIENSTLPKAVPSGTYCPPTNTGNGTGEGNGTGNGTGGGENNNGNDTGNNTGNGSDNQTTPPGDNTGNNSGNQTDNNSQNDSTDDTTFGPEPLLERKVLIIGIDGVRGDVAESSARRNSSAFGRIQEEGAWSFNSKVGPISISGPSWSSMLTGVWCDRHGVVGNSFEGSRHDEVLNMFELIEAEDPEFRTAAVMYWKKIDEIILADKSADIQERYDNDFAIRDRAIELLTTDAELDFLFLNLDAPDNAGHEFGFSPDAPEYVAIVESADDMAAAILAALDARNTSGEEWLVIITSDHGGGGEKYYTHTPSTEIDRTTFMLVLGGATVAGEMRNSPVVVDTAVTALTHLNITLPSGEAALDGRPAAFEPDAEPARIPTCEIPKEWYESTTNLTLAGLAIMLTITLTILGLVQLRVRDVANQSELNGETYGDEDDLVVIDDVTDDAENQPREDLGPLE